MEHTLVKKVELGFGGSLVQTTKLNINSIDKRFKILKVGEVIVPCDYQGLHASENVFTYHNKEVLVDRSTQQYFKSGEKYNYVFFTVNRGEEVPYVQTYTFLEKVSKYFNGFLTGVHGLVLLYRTDKNIFLDKEIFCSDSFISFDEKPLTRNSGEICMPYMSASQDGAMLQMGYAKNFDCEDYLLLFFK